jgi:hypothetical protein
MRFPGIIVARQRGVIRELRRIADALERAYPPPAKEEDLRPIKDEDIEHVVNEELARQKLEEMFEAAVKQGRDPQELIDWNPEDLQNP